MNEDFSMCISSKWIDKIDIITSSYHYVSVLEMCETIYTMESKERKRERVDFSTEQNYSFSHFFFFSPKTSAKTILKAHPRAKEKERIHKKWVHTIDVCSICAMALLYRLVGTKKKKEMRRISSDWSECIPYKWVWAIACVGIDDEAIIVPR